MISKSDLLKTLKQDGTSTGINKEFIAKILSGTIALECSDITQLTKAQLDELKCGDIVAKKTGNQWHAYIVSYKGDGAGQGICLTYTDASVVETVSYDRSGDGWLYNSTDVSTISLESFENKDLKVNTIEQSQANWEYDLDLTSLNDLPADCEVTNIYSKIIQWNRELHIVFNFKITNNGESASTSFTSTSNYIDLPEEVAERIIDFGGKSVTESSGESICAGVFNEGSQNYPINLEALQRSFVIKNTSTSNRMMINIHDIAAINPGQTLLITGRISLDLA